MVVVVEGGRGSAHAEVGGFDVSAVVVLLEVLEFRGWVAGIGFLGGGVGVSRGCTAEVMVLNLASWPAATARAWTAEAWPDVAGLMRPGYTGDEWGMPSLG